MRRVDRRLRELIREASAILARIGGGHDIAGASFDSLCMRLKARSAQRGRDWVLQREPRRSKERASLTLLADRVNRHALGAWAIGEEVAEALKAETNRVAIAKPRQEPVFSSWLMRNWDAALAMAGAAVAAAIAVALLGPSPLPTGDEGVLGGTPDMAPTATAPATRNPGPSPVTVTVSFDDARIGSSWGPIEGNGSVGVVAFPTSFDRSVEVLTEDGRPVETCLKIDMTKPVATLEVDAFLEDAGAVAGSVSLLDGTDRRLVEVALRADESVARAGEGARATGPGVEARAWHRVRLVERMNRVEFSVERLMGGQSRSTGATLSVDSLEADRVCLGVAGEPGASAYYDNLMVINRSRTGG